MKWEYKVVTALMIDGVALEAMLNNLGDDGWSLAGCEDMETDRRYILRRPKVQQPGNIEAALKARVAKAAAEREKQPTAEQREAAAVEAINMANDEPRLNKLELSIIERCGSVFTPSVASRLLAKVSERRKELKGLPPGCVPHSLPAMPLGLSNPPTGWESDGSDFDDRPF